MKKKKEKKGSFLKRTKIHEMKYPNTDHLIKLIIKNKKFNYCRKTFESKSVYSENIEHIS